MVLSIKIGGGLFRSLFLYFLLNQSITLVVDLFCPNVSYGVISSKGAVVVVVVKTLKSAVIAVIFFKARNIAFVVIAVICFFAVDGIFVTDDVRSFGFFGLESDLVVTL